MKKTGKKMLKLGNLSEDSEDSNEEPFDKPSIPPKDISIVKKIKAYEKYLLLWNHKSMNSTKIEVILKHIADQGLNNEIEFAKNVLLIMEYCGQPTFVKDEKMTSFCRFITSLIPEERTKILTITIPYIASLALQIELMHPDGTLPLLSMNKENFIKLSSREVSCIMANLFFSSIPLQDKYLQLGEYRFYGLMTDKANIEQLTVNEKLKCIFGYFESIMEKEPEGFITISRNCLSGEELKKYSVDGWLKSEKPMMEMKLEANMRIEDQLDMIQVDFANKFIGGGIDGSCFQEQILFSVCPELYVTCLVCEAMNNNEAIIITGIQKFSQYKGYREEFRYMGLIVDPLLGKIDELSRIPRQILAIDALEFPNLTTRIKQFGVEITLRELNKAFVGFKGDFQCDETDRKPIATGKWGCGSFFGCVEYKWLIQWIAASECERKMLFCSSTSKELEEFNVLLMKFKGMKVGEVAKILFDLGEKVKQRLTEEENKDPNPSEIIRKLLSN